MIVERGITEPAGSAFLMMISRTRIALVAGLMIAGFALPTMGLAAQAKSKIFIKNDTAYALTVESIATSGDPLNKKAWKKGAAEIPQGDRQPVLTLTRSGKVNWMDPTPRFVEPGKTVVFAVKVIVAGTQEGNAITLKQKLLGTGKASKMWHAIEVAGQSLDWILDDTQVQGTWNATESIRLKFSYQAFTEKGATHIQYEFSAVDE